MAPGPSPSFRSPYRRRRITWSILLLALGSLLYLGTHTETFGSWSLPASLKDIGHSIASSRGRVIADAKAHDTVRLHVQEIHGLMHFVTEYPEKRLDDGEITGEASESVHIDGSQPIDLQAYSPSGDDWQTYTKTLRKKHPLIVFSKSYCPYVYHCLFPLMFVSEPGYRLSLDSPSERKPFSHRSNCHQHHLLLSWTYAPMVRLSKLS